MHKLSGQRMVVIRMSESIATYELIDEPKEYKVSRDSYEYKRVVCKISNLELVSNQLSIL